MPRKPSQSKQNKNNETSVPVVETQTVSTVSTVATVPTVATVTKTTKKTKTSPVEEVEPVTPPTPTPSPSSQTVEGESSDKKSRVVPTKELVLDGFTELLTLLEDEIVRMRESQQKSKGVKFLRSFGKKVKTLQNNATRVMKQKHKTNRKNNTNSGFLKPVKISKDMAKFTGWSDSELKSRVDVTKYICNYIKENNLQNPTDRRQIVADKKLAKLLDYSETDKPLTYYRIQTYMKKHFTNPDSAK